MDRLRACFRVTVWSREQQHTSYTIRPMKPILFASVFFVSSAFATTHMSPVTATAPSSISHIKAVELPWPNPHSPDMPNLAAELPWPNPHSPDMPNLAFELPWPNPHSPDMPNLAAELPWPNPHSPDMPNLAFELPWPDSHSPEVRCPKQVALLKSAQL